jgi:vesicle-fusing ATPase
VTFDDELVTGKDSYVEIGPIVFTVKPHDGMKKGQIGLNVMQRTCAQVTEGALISPKAYQLPTDASINLISCRFEIDTYGTGKARIELQEQRVVDLLREQYVNQIFTVGQTFFIKYDSLTLTLTAKSMDAPALDDKETKSTGHVVRSATRGVLLAQSRIKISVAARSARLIKMEELDERPPLFDPEWSFEQMGIGGLDKEFGALFRRAFASRLFPAQVIEQLGIKHVKGMLLFGPPGTGKTLIARQIGKILKGKEPKVVNGPEILNKYVGASEENIRNLFADAETEYAEKKEKSSLHIIIFDEIDAICKARGSMTGSTGVHDTVVNQLLSKIDGVNSPNNILVIGMTNRKDMIDPALLRPGRLEVHVEIGLPDEKGRLQILNIHTRKMRENGRMSKDVDLPRLAELTKNFSGAEIEGLVKSASSYALYGSIDVTKEKVEAKIDTDNIIVTMAHFEHALDEVIPSFGVQDDELQTLMRGETLVDFSPEFVKLARTGATLVEQVRNSDHTPLLSVLLEGSVGSGKTALAAKIALDSKFPYTKVISPDNFVGFNEAGKCQAINKIFEDAYKSPLSLIIVDNIERLLEYVPLGPRFSNQVLQTLLVLFKKNPTHEGRKLMIIATTSSLHILKDMEFKSVFNVIARVPQLTRPEHVVKVFEQLKVPVEAAELQKIASSCVFPIGVKQMLMLIEMAKQNNASVTASRFQECINDAGLDDARLKLDFSFDEKKE